MRDTESEGNGDNPLTAWQAAGVRTVGRASQKASPGATGDNPTSSSWGLDLLSSAYQLIPVTVAGTRDGAVDGDGDGDYENRLF
ncbi:hypothetical protein Tco_1064034 [Tanacetum coccineum]